MSTSPSFDSVRPNESIEIDKDLSLVPRVKFLLTLHRADHSVKPLEEWQLKRSLVDFMRSSFSVPVPITEDDVVVHGFKDLKKRKREDAVARGALFVRDLGCLSKIINSRFSEVLGKQDDVKELEKNFKDWRSSVVEKMDQMELNLEGVKFKLTVEVPVSDDFDRMKKEWEEHYAFGNRGYARSGKQQPDTVVIRGVPSRWFAEPRVSSKPSMLVTHTIFSAFGKIRNLNVAEDDYPSNNAEEERGNIVSGLHCKIVVQFEKYTDFYTALKSLSGRSLQKQGSRLKADYEATWDRDDFFRNARNETQEKGNRNAALGARDYKSEAPRRQTHHHSRYSPENERPKRFKE